MNQPISQPQTFVYLHNDPIEKIIDLKGTQPLRIWEASQEVTLAQGDLDELKANYDFCYKQMFLVVQGKTVTDKDAMICTDPEMETRAQAIQRAKEHLAHMKAIYELRTREADALESQVILVNQLLRNKI